MSSTLNMQDVKKFLRRQSFNLEFITSDNKSLKAFSITYSSTNWSKRADNGLKKSLEKQNLFGCDVFNDVIMSAVFQPGGE